MDWKSCLSNPNDPNSAATLNCIGPLFQNILGALLAFAGVAALFFIIYSGIKFITSGGDAKQVEGARKTLTYAIIGLVLILFSFFILNVISTVTGVGCIKQIKQFGFTNCTSGGSNSTSTASPSPTQQRISPQNRELNP